MEKNDLTWLTGCNDIEEFAEKVNKSTVLSRINFGLDKHCDSCLIDYRNQFVSNGYVLVPRVFNKLEIETYEKIVTDAVKERLKYFDCRINSNFYTQQFTQCLNLWEDFEKVKKIAFSLRLTRIAKSLLGVEKIRIWQDQALFKYPKGRGTSAHHDLPFWPLDNTECITAWIVLSKEGSTLDNGALGYIPKSHSSGLLHFSNISTGNSLQEFEERDKELLNNPLLNDRKPEFLEVKPGSVVFHHGLTVHLSKANISNKIRKVYTVVYFKDGIKRGSQIGVKDQKHIVVDRKGLERKDGELLDSDLTPIAHPITSLPRSPSGISLEEFTRSKGSLPNPKLINSKL